MKSEQSAARLKKGNWKKSRSEIRFQKRGENFVREVSCYSPFEGT